MLIYSDAAAIAAAPTTAPVDHHLRRLIADRVHDWTATDLLDLTVLVIVEPGDDERKLRRRIAYSPLANPVEGSRFGEPGFEPSFDWLQHHPGGWTEIMETVGNDGWAMFLFVADQDGTDPELRALIRAYPNGRPAGEI